MLRMRPAASEASALPAELIGVRVGAKASSRPARWQAALTLDLVMVVAALAAAAIGAGAANARTLSAGWSVAFVGLLLVLYARQGLYGSRVRPDFLEDARIVVVQTTLAAMAILSLQAVFAPELGAANVLRPTVFTLVYVVLGRAMLHWSRLAALRNGEGLRPTLVVGAGRVGRLVARRLRDHPELGLLPVGYIDKDPLAADHGDDDDDLPVLGASWDLEAVVARHKVEQVIVAFSTAPHEVLSRFVDRCAELGVDVAVVPRLFERSMRRLAVEHVGGLPLHTVRVADPKGWYFSVKYALDRVFAAVGLVLAAPVLVAGALAVRVSMGRPILFRQERIGRDGQRFEILKLRTMTEHGDTSRVGRFLRRTSADELPQLLNVLRGEMSLIGPRPERPELVDEFVRSVHRYDDRHRVKSGITGWAQVHGLGRGRDRFTNGALSDRVEWDNYYIENFSFWLDLKIVLLTFAAVLRYRQPGGQPETLPPAEPEPL